VSGKRPPEAARVLLVRTSALGDIVHALPVLAALRRQLPHSTLGWVIDEAFAPLLDGHELIDQVYAVPLRRWRAGGRSRGGELAAFWRRLRAFRADVALDLMGNHKGAVIARLSGARRRIGAARAARREPSSALWLNETVPVPAGHTVDRGLALLAALELAAGPAEFVPERLACGRDRPLARGAVYLHPGAAWGNKRYPPELWGQVAALVSARLRLPVVVGAAPGEEALADAVAAASGGAARPLPAPSLADLAGAVRSARLVLAGDTGAAHLAHACGVPVVVVHGPTDPALHGPYAAPGSVVDHRLPCSFCHQRMAEAKACLLGIRPEAVVERAVAVLDAD
jgi:heptosyltransferase-1